MSYSTAVELPSELIRSILDQLVARNPGIRLRGSKRGLAACSLTCRHWAEVIRPVIFYSIALREPDDITQLLEFFDSGSSVGPPLSNCIEELGLHVNTTALVTSMSCIHHYYRLIKRIPAHHAVMLTIYNDQPTIAQAISEPPRHLEIRGLLKVLSSSLPKTLPGALFPISILTLSGLRLRSVADLVNAVNGLPSVRNCSCSGLSFTEDATTRRPAIRRSLSKLVLVSIFRCGDSSLQSQLELCSMITDARKRLGFGINAWTGIHSAMLTVPDCECSVSIQLMTDSTREHSHNFGCIK
jgi:hypothetical protein